MPKEKWDKHERRENGNGRRVCPMHDGIVRDAKDSVQFKMFALIMTAAVGIVGGGFGWFGNDLLKIKDAQMMIIKTTAEQTDRNTVAMAAMQKEIMNNVAENQRETRNQIEKIAAQLENVTKIQQVVLNEISYLKRYDDMDRVFKERKNR